MEPSLEQERARRLIELIRRQGGRAVAAKLELGRVLARIRRRKLLGATGFTTFRDQAASLGLSIAEARELAALGIIEQEVPRIIEDVQAGRLDAAKLLRVAPLIEQERVPGEPAQAVAEREQRYRRLLRETSPRGVERFVRQQRFGPRTTADGRQVRTLPLPLSPDARSMADDLQARLSQDQERVVPLVDVFGWAVRTALASIAAGKPVGPFRYRIVEMDGPSATPVMQRVGTTERVAGLQRSGVSLEPSGPPANPREVIERYLEQRGIAPGENPLEALDRWLPDGVELPDPCRKAAAKLLRKELLLAGRRHRRSRFWQARLLWFARRQELWVELGYANWTSMVVAEFGMDPAKASQLALCGRICQRYPQVRQLFADGRISFSALRTIGPHVDDQTIDDLLLAAQRSSVHELERLAVSLRECRGASKPQRRRADRFPVEMYAEDWQHFDQLLSSLGECDGRRPSNARALEAALWLACDAAGPPRPLKPEYRIHIYSKSFEDEDGTFHDEGKRQPVVWQQGLGTFHTLREDDLRRILRGDVEHYSVSSGLERAACWAEANPGPQEPPGWLKEAILLRDGRMCAVPGCTAGMFLHTHHLIERSRGGGSHPSNLLACCSGCHGRIHSDQWTLRYDAQALAVSSYR